MRPGAWEPSEGRGRDSIHIDGKSRAKDVIFLVEASLLSIAYRAPVWFVVTW